MKKTITISISILVIFVMIGVYFFNVASNAESIKSINNNDIASSDAIGPINILESPIDGDISDIMDIINTPNPSDDNKKTDTKSDIYTTIVPEYGCTQIEYEVFEKINKYRKQKNLSPVTWSDELYKAATIRSKELVKNLSHTRPDGTACFTVSNTMNNENLAFGYAKSSDVFNGWINSTGHRENILNPNNKTTAVSLYKVDKGYRYYWINVFGF